MTFGKGKFGFGPGLGDADRLGVVVYDGSAEDVAVESFAFLKRLRREYFEASLRPVWL